LWEIIYLLFITLIMITQINFLTINQATNVLRRNFKYYKMQRIHYATLLIFSV